MTATYFGDIVDAAIPLCGGLYATLLGFRIVGKKPGVDARYDARMTKHCGMLQLLGPLLVGFGLFKLFGTFS